VVGEALIEKFDTELNRNRWNDTFLSIEKMLAEAPFSSIVMKCMIRLVENIIRIETDRGEIARTDRSTLATEAQPYQDLFDRILFRLAGLTDAEAEGLERRLATML